MIGTGGSFVVFEGMFS